MKNKNKTYENININDKNDINNVSKEETDISICTINKPNVFEQN